MNRIKRLFKILLGAACGLAVVCTILVALMVGHWDEAAIRDFPIEAPPPQEELAPPDRLVVATYNIHYGAGPADAFAFRARRETVEANIQAIADGVASCKPDIVCLQEADFASARSFHIDQVKVLSEKLALPWIARVPNWQRNYVPYPYWPPREHYGRMFSGIAVLSRFPLKTNTRYLFPKPEANPWWYNLFYIDRCVQRVEVAFGEKTMVLWNLHLEAWKTDARSDQAHRLKALVDADGKEPFILAGDFNALPPGPPGDVGIPPEVVAKYQGDTTMSTVLGIRNLYTDFDRVQALLTFSLTFPSREPDRRIDYVLPSRGWQVYEAGVVLRGGTGSDHLPVAVAVGW